MSEQYEHAPSHADGLDQILGLIHAHEELNENPGMILTMTCTPNQRGQCMDRFIEDATRRGKLCTTVNLAETSAPLISIMKRIGDSGVDYCLLWNLNNNPGHGVLLASLNMACDPLRYQYPFGKIFILTPEELRLLSANAPDAFSRITHYHLKN